MLILFALTSFLATNRSSRIDAACFGTRASPDSDVCDNINNCRRLFDIVWGCLATVFACIWVSIHPNIPPPPPPALPKGASLWRQAKWRLIDSQGPLRSRLKLMLVGLLAPELIAGFAARQLIMAWEISKSHPIVTFAQIDSEDAEVSNDMLSVTVKSTDLLPDSEAKRSETKTLRAIQRITEAAIQDKSKGDAFSKGIAFFQGLWFVMQCIARTAQHLPLTELEVATLAFAVVNILTWLLWWGKPLDVRDPVVIEVSPGLRDASPLPVQQPRPWSSKFTSLLGIVYDVEEYDPVANNAVPTFWYASSDVDDTGVLFMGQLLVAAIFGAIHCIAWHAAFPSIAEMWLWRVSAVLIAGVPIALPFVAVMPDGIRTGLLIFSILVYIAARFILLVLPFTALRDLPSATFVDVNWSIYIPHL
ncbi:hypothetical protein C8F01DRAFT_1059245 [Mycena amicta]|nr:hypothetical protein C8F01DRAFT_1059245 [Mycena amicta]